jgi:nucleoside-triphosphatase THEP1
VDALEAAAEDGPDIVLVDEIGPMEMTSQKFRHAVSALLGSGKILVATVRLGTNYKELEAASTRADTMNITLTRENREASLNLIASRIEDWLSRS